MSEPMWFLDNLEQPEFKFKECFSENVPTNSEPKDWSEESSKSSSSKPDGQSNKQETVEGVNWTEINTGQELGKNPHQDETSFRPDLENSPLYFAKHSIEEGENPRIHITISSDNLQQLNKEQKTYRAASSSSPEIQYVAEESLLRDGTSEFQITLDAKENGKSIEEEKLPVNPETGTKESAKQTIYVILDSGNAGQSSAGEIKGSDAKHCTQIGSAVINLNDLLSPKHKLTSGNENPSTPVTYSSDNKIKDGKPKVELVITVKDERKNPQSVNSDKCSTCQDVARLKELLASAADMSTALTDTSHNTVVRNADTIRNLRSSSSSSSQQTWQGQNSQAQWTGEERDSYIRESDGARCYRTVWTSPRGRKVQTQCYKDDRNVRRQRRSFEDARNYDWSPGFGSFWREMDDDNFNRIFARANRLMFF